MLRYLIAVSLLTWASQVMAADNRLSQQQEQARQQRAELQTRIRKLQDTIAQRDQQRRSADQALRQSESAISDISRRLADLAADRQVVQDRLVVLEQQREHETHELQRLRDELAGQLRGQYLGNLSPWTALLSGDDPHAIGRNMAYLSYVSRAQTRAVEAVRASLERLQDNQLESEQQQAQLTQLLEDTAREQEQLEQQRTERQKALAGIEDALRAERAQADALQKDDKRLEQLIHDLERAIAEQAEKQRQARERERAREQQQAQAPTPSQGRYQRPASGPIQGRFGAQRPEGGVWRGIVIRAPEGSAVRAVAPGRVAYVDWLSGFGNIMIVDHGEQTMSVYAYNQGLLKEVGDQVETGDVIATVGSTGGQVEPGLYFELRQAGKPVNPELWLAD